MMLWKFQVVYHSVSVQSLLYLCLLGRHLKKRTKVYGDITDGHRVGLQNIPAHVMAISIEGTLEDCCCSYED